MTSPTIFWRAGGTDVTIYGSGFGSDIGQLQVTVGGGEDDGGAACAVQSISADAVYCRVPQTLPRPRAERLPRSSDDAPEETRITRTI